MDKSLTREDQRAAVREAIQAYRVLREFLKKEFVAAGVPQDKIEEKIQDEIDKINPRCSVCGCPVNDRDHGNAHQRYLQWRETHPVWDSQKETWLTLRSMGVTLKPYQPSSQTKSVWIGETLIGYVTKVQTEWGACWDAHDARFDLVPHPSTTAFHASGDPYPPTRIVAIALLFKAHTTNQDRESLR